MINELLLKEIKVKLRDVASPTLEDFLKAGFLTLKDCSRDTGIKEPTLYHVWKGLKPPSRANEKILKAYTHGLVNWDHL
jgi:predicted transcriptional regulator